jgi:hypothetical protein
MTGMQGIGGLNSVADVPAALVVSSGASSAVPVISAAAVVPMLVRVLFIVVSFRLAADVVRLLDPAPVR